MSRKGFQMSRFNFGIHEGEPLSLVPDDYLVFVATCKNIKLSQRKMATAELTERGKSHLLPSKVKIIKK